MVKDVRVWGIHAMDDALFLNEQKPVIAIGWAPMGDMSDLPDDREAFRKRCKAVYDKSTKNQIASYVGVIYRFIHEAQVDDYVVFPSKADRRINIGVITGGYFHDGGASAFPNMRPVRWLKSLPREVFSQGSLYEVGSALTFFSIRNYADEFLNVLSTKTEPKLVVEEDDTALSYTADSILETTKDYVIKELSRHFKGYDLEAFVANLLGTMGYRTRLSPKGGDSGIDIVAYKDELPPRIVVQVKSVDGDIPETVLHSLKGAMSEGDYGLFITLTDYTKKAQIFLNTHPIIKAINGSQLVELILDNYERLDKKYQAVLSLKKVYIPIPAEPNPN